MYPAKYLVAAAKYGQHTHGHRLCQLFEHATLPPHHDTEAEYYCAYLITYAHCTVFPFGTGLAKEVVVVLCILPKWFTAIPVGAVVANGRCRNECSTFFPVLTQARCHKTRSMHSAV